MVEEMTTATTGIAAEVVAITRNTIAIGMVVPSPSCQQ